MKLSNRLFLKIHYLSAAQKVCSPTVQRGGLLDYLVAPASFQDFYELVLFEIQNKQFGVLFGSERAEKDGVRVSVNLDIIG